MCISYLEKKYWTWSQAFKSIGLYSFGSLDQKKYFMYL